MLSFKIFGIPVSVQPWFWLTMLFIGGGLSAKNSTEMMEVAIFMVAGFISILVHELGHALTIRKYQQPTAITLVAFGGFASYPMGVFDRKQNFLVTAAGPAIQIALGLLMIFLLTIVPFPPKSFLRLLVVNLAQISLIWAIFNCLPIYPMDGGQMLAAILGPKRERSVYLIGTIFAIIIGVLGYLWLRGIMIPIFMGLFAYQNWQSYSSGAPFKRS